MEKALTPLEAAKQHLNYQETPINKTIFGAWYGMNFQPWCAMFVSWAYHEAGLGKFVNASGKKGFASCDAGLKWFAKKNKLVPVAQAQPGDLVFFQFDDDAMPDHVGIVEKNNTRLKRLVVIEGNTSPDSKGSQSNGGGVYRKKRSYGTVMAVARPIKEKNERVS